VQQGASHTLPPTRFQPKKQHRTLAHFYFGPLSVFHRPHGSLFTPKMSTGRSRIFISAPFRSSADRMAQFHVQNEHRTLANFLFSRFGPLFVPKFTFKFPTTPI
jgi:hypothetical protein